jgi:predicted cupin superfamily sugar epimerase
MSSPPRRGIVSGADVREQPSGDLELQADEFSAFHRVVGTDETWELREGGPLEVHVIRRDGCHEKRRLSLEAGGIRTETIERGTLRAARLAPGARMARVARLPRTQLDGLVREFPTAREIVREHPLHEAVVLELTRC